MHWASSAPPQAHDFAQTGMQRNYCGSGSGGYGGAPGEMAWWKAAAPAADGRAAMGGRYNAPPAGSWPNGGGGAPGVSYGSYSGEAAGRSQQAHYYGQVNCGEQQLLRGLARDSAGWTQVDVQTGAHAMRPPPRNDGRCGSSEVGGGGCRNGSGCCGTRVTSSKASSNAHTPFGSPRIGAAVTVDAVAARLKLA